MSRRFEGFQWRFSAYPSHPIALFKGCNFEFFGPAKPGVVLVSNYLGRFWVTRDCTYGLTDHVGLRKFDVFCLFDFFQMFKTLTILKVLLAIWLCRHVLWACHKKHSPHSLSRHGRVNSENSCALRSCARCCGPWCHSRRLMDFVTSVWRCVTLCPVLLNRKLQESTLMRI